MLTSIRARVTLAACAIVIGAVASVGITIDVLIRRQMVRLYDESVAMRVRTLATLVHSSDAMLFFDFAGELMPEFERAAHADYFEVWDSDGDVIERSLSLDDAHLPRTFGSVATPAAFDLRLPDGRHGRAIGIEFDASPAEADESVEGLDSSLHPHPSQSHRAVIVVASGRAGLDDAFVALRRVVVASSVVASLVALIVTAWIVRRSMRPLIGLARHLEQMDAARLDEPLARMGLPSELIPICERLDDLFARVQAAFDRERRMTANLAHELRTPIAELRAATDVAERWPDDAALRLNAIETASDVAARMGVAVDALLKLARLEAGEDEIEGDRVNLAALFEDAWRPLVRGCAARELQLVDEIPRDLEASTDRGLLALVVSNIVRNAVVHADAPGPLTVSAEATPTRIRWIVRNRASRLSRADLPYLDQPFWQKQPAAPRGTHVGLGLALSDAILRFLDSHMEFTLVAGELTLTLDLPRAAPNAGKQPGIA